MKKYFEEPVIEVVEIVDVVTDELSAPQDPSWGEL